MGQGGKEPPVLLPPQPPASSLLALQGAAPGVFRPCPASGAGSSADQRGTERPHTPAAGQEARAAPALGAQAQKWGLGPERLRVAVPSTSPRGQPPVPSWAGWVWGAVLGSCEPSYPLLTKPQQCQQRGAGLGSVWLRELTPGC